MIETAKKVKAASLTLLSIDEEKRKEALLELKALILKNTAMILSENAADLEEAKKLNLSSALLERLKLSETSLRNLADSCEQIANQETVVGTISEEYKRPNGLIIKKQRIPLGVILMIFESRPNVMIDGAALAIKSGNAIILKGGKEAKRSNQIFFDLIQEAIKGRLPQDSIEKINSRDEVEVLLSLNQYVDLVVPRGGTSLVQEIKKKATMPVIAHDKGLCHLYVDHEAEIDLVEKIVLNSKTQRPGVCNATETLLIHEKYPQTKELLFALLSAGVELRGCEKSKKYTDKIILATEADYATEYLSMSLSVKIVSSLQEAIDHIKRFSSQHTEAILSKNPLSQELFAKTLDSSAIVVNASTRFNDGGELGLGAELGISTTKFHAYGPMGAKEMTTTRFLILGNGQIRN